MNFRNFYQKEILKESPMRIGMNYGDVLDNAALNQEETLQKIDTLNKVDSISIGSTVDLDIYRDVRNELIDDSFINKTPLVSAYFMYIQHNGDMNIRGVWNSKMSKGLAFHILFDYYLKIYKTITSDNVHTTQGERFWKRIIERATKENLTVKAIIKNDEVDIDDVNRFWGSTPEFYNYKLRIYSSVG